MSDASTRAALARVLAGLKDGTHGTFHRVAHGRPLLSAKNVLNGRIVENDTESVISSEDFDSIVSNGYPRRGDVLLTIVGTIGRSAVFDRDEPAAFQRSVAMLRPNSRMLDRFLCYQVQSKEFQEQLSLRSKSSAQSGIYLGDLVQCRVQVPAPARQLEMADYLDRETAEIDAFIADQEELIALLEERRSAALLDALELDRGWPRGNIRRFAAMRTGHTPSRSTEEYWSNTSIPWFTLADVWQLRQGARFLGETKELVSHLGVANSAAEVLPAGTVVLSRTASVGFTGIMPTPMATSQDYWNWVPGPQLRPEYLWYQFRAMRPVFLALQAGSTHKTIYQGDAAAISIAVPPLDTQRRICAELDVLMRELDATVADAREAIALSKERRAALISAAVNGQIDVTEKKRVLV